jgi:hypothetical protein
MPEIPTKNKRPPMTRAAWILKTHTIKKGRRLGTWYQEGEVRDNPDGTTDVYLHSTPIGGFDGHIQIVPHGRQPVDIMSEPQRPDAAAGDDDGDEFEE